MSELKAAQDGYDTVSKIAKSRKKAGM